MRQITLPSEEDTTFQVNLPNGETLTFDIFTLDLMRAEAFDLAQKAKEQSFLPQFCRLFKHKFKFAVTESQAVILLGTVDTATEDLKKKSLTSPGQSDSSE